MSFGAEALRWMDGRADGLAQQLDRFRTPGSGQPVAPSVVGPIYRTARVSGSLEEIERVLRLYPSSTMARRTGSSRPQVVFFNEQLQRLVFDVRAATATGLWTRGQEVSALAHVVGLAMRQLRVQRGRGG